MSRAAELPSVGCTVAFDPCPECYEMILRDIGCSPAPGGRQECSVCRNVIVSIGVEKNEEPILDRFRPFEATTRQDELVDCLFDVSVFNGPAAKAWLAHKSLEGFEDKGMDARKYLRFSKSNAPVHVYVRLDRGVLGRLTSKEVPHRFTGAGR